MYFPDDLYQKIARLLKSWGYDPQQPKPLALAIKKLSDHFIGQEQRTTPWNEPWAKAAYIGYFLPLNYIRALKVLGEAQSLGFFEESGHIIDIGAGPGTLHLAMQALFQNLPHEFTFVETHSQCKEFFEALSAKSDTSITWSSNYQKIRGHQNSTLCFSYSLNEFKHPLKLMTESQSLVIIEPSTQLHGRELLGLRSQLIENGFYIWAPCTHQLDCPLLSESKKDWCHSRMSWNYPDWLEKIEDHLPMKNRNLTFSYLLAKKQEPPALLKDLARTVGDLRKEKGKNRQMICRGSDREFIAWLTRDKSLQPPTIERGELVKIGDNLLKKSNELRIEKNADIKKREDL